MLRLYYAICWQKLGILIAVILSRRRLIRFVAEEKNQEEAHADAG